MKIYKQNLIDKHKLVLLLYKLNNKKFIILMNKQKN